jgi:Tfp pilus assembly protein PilF
LTVSRVEIHQQEAFVTWTFRTMGRAFWPATLLFVLAGCGDPPADEAPLPIEVVRTQIEGIAYLEENRIVEAGEVFERIVAMAPDHPAGHAGLAEARLREGRLTEAAESARRALELEPDDSGHLLLLATILALDGDRDGARARLREILDRTGDHQRALFALARLEADSEDPEGAERARPHLERLVGLTNGNAVVRLELLEVLLRTGDADGAAAQLEALEQQIPVFPVRGQEPFDEALEAALAGDAAGALAPARIFHESIRTLGRYHDDLRAIRGPMGILEGVPNVSFLGRGPDGIDADEVASLIRFTDVTADVGLEGVEPAVTPAAGGVGLAVGDLTGNGARDIVVGSGRFFRNQGGSFVEASDELGLSLDTPAKEIVAADYGNTGHLDLLLVGEEGSRLFRNEGEGAFTEVTGDAGVGQGARGGLFADLDHDGDLDLLLFGEGATHFHRNDLDDHFTERGEALGIAGATGGVDAAFGDLLDNDLLDLVIARADGPPAVLVNLREGRFQDHADDFGLGEAGPSSALALGDFDNDGFPDLFLAEEDPTRSRLYRNAEGFGFEVDERPSEMYRALEDLRITDVHFVDYDNDGWLDLVVAGEPLEEGARGLRLFRNAGPGEWVDHSDALPHLDAVSKVRTLDLAGDGDLDLVVALPDGTLRLLRNDGGNVNHSLTLRLVGLTTGSGKNNHHGIGARIEVRAGPLYQVREVTEPVTTIGLAEHPRAEVVRIRWPNGVVQDLHYPDAETTLAEEQMLKGSCPFLYAWDGESYVFVTDVLWQSALGMPVGIGGAGSGREYAPADPSRQHVRIPGDAIAPRDGSYRFQFTSELWETIYLDQVRLVVVDHPESAELFVDERFPQVDGPEPELHAVANPRAPVSATDERGRDLLPALLEADHDYVGGLRRGPYQGITREPHDLVLDFGALDTSGDLRLFLRGWVFPSDASINVAVARSESVEVVPPHLQVRDESGEWVTVIDDLGFPAGKDKTLVIDLADRFLSDDHRVRIRTNMELYWDHAFIEEGRPDISVRKTTLAPTTAELDERGFSAMYRKGGRYGPHWFDFAEVTERSPWRPIEGPFTRLGDVLPLLGEADSRTVVMAPGDAIALHFDAEGVPELDEGWTRTFLFYSEGWVKDADLNTAEGHRTLPLPFHGMEGYPYEASEAPLPDPVWRDYTEGWLTRSRGIDGS